MPGKPKKTVRELQALIMQEVRKHPELRNIQDVAVTPSVQSGGAPAELGLRLGERRSSAYVS